MTRPVSTFTLAQLEDSGSAQRSSPEADRMQVEIMLGLLEMRRAGLLHAVHVHSSKIAVELPSEPGVKRSITWTWAAKFVAEFHTRELRKPALREAVISTARGRFSQ